MIGTVPGRQRHRRPGPVLAGDPFGVDAVALEDTLTPRDRGRADARALRGPLRDTPPHPARPVPAADRPDRRASARSYRDVSRACEERPRAPGELDLVERIFFLRRMPVFSKASINALFEVSRGVTEIRYPPGHRRCGRKARPPSGVFLVTNGQPALPQRGGPRLRGGPGFPSGRRHEALGEVPRWYEAVTETPVTGLQGPDRDPDRRLRGQLRPGSATTWPGSPAASSGPWRFASRRRTGRASARDTAGRGRPTAPRVAPRIIARGLQCGRRSSSSACPGASSVGLMESVKAVQDYTAAERAGSARRSSPARAIPPRCSPRWTAWAWAPCRSWS